MKILVSACLLGENCRYDASNNLIPNLSENLKNYQIIPVCPEVLGNLPTPRPPAEIKNNSVVTKDNEEVTLQFIEGANKTLDIALSNFCDIAILKEKSPSCGSSFIYDGSFSKSLIKGEGITTNLLRKNNILVLNENNYIEYFSKQNKEE